MHRPCRHAHHAGFSMLEVLIATAILAGSAMVLSGMIATGSRAGVEADRRTRGAGIVATIIDETIALQRFEPLEQDGVLIGDENWAWRMTIVPEPRFGMLRLTAEATSTRDGNQDPWSDPTTARRSIRLVRWTRDATSPTAAPSSSPGETSSGRPVSDGASYSSTSGISSGDFGRTAPR